MSDSMFTQILCQALQDHSNSLETTSWKKIEGDVGKFNYILQINK
jgi:hypothetical protein